MNDKYFYIRAGILPSLRDCRSVSHPGFKPDNTDLCLRLQICLAAAATTSFYYHRAFIIGGSFYVYHSACREISKTWIIVALKPPETADEKDASVSRKL
jgi:hypothetical protein